MQPFDERPREFHYKFQRFSSNHRSNRSGKEIRIIAPQFDSGRPFLYVSAGGMPTTRMFDDDGFVGKKLAPFNPSSDEVIRTAIEMLQIGQDDVVYDLGCGDGRMLVEAVKTSGARGVGVEYHKKFSDRAQERVAEAGLESKIDIVHGNVLGVDAADATVAFVYLVPAGIAAVKETLVSLLKRGGRVATYVFSLPGLNPVRIQTFKATKLYLYAASSLEPDQQTGVLGTSTLYEIQQGHGHGGRDNS